ncbi:hypothetical protein GTQ40_13425 [Flavobacteriaceae bacterium R38]|nr:hypothetical protein [Flavobacteriaceae bacterium R38]
MKKRIQILLIAVITSLSSCGGSIESDAKKVAELQCEVKELAQKALSGDQSALSESQKLANKANTLTQQLQKKYTTIEDRQKFQQAIIKASQKCN